MPRDTFNTPKLDDARAWDVIFGFNHSKNPITESEETKGKINQSWNGVRPINKTELSGP
jgi:hypothetical protein